MPFFSIIIPVYNVAPYLRECLDSVLAQTFADWEAVCVDDGSTDGSGAILDEYAAKDPRFRVIHQPNAGVSAARNAALDNAEGEWLTFLDGDDKLRKEAFAAFEPYVIGNFALDGVLVYPYVQEWDGGVTSIQTTKTHVLVGDATKEDMFLGPYAANGYPFSRIYRRSTFGHLRFRADIALAEDICFWFDALCLEAKWMILNAEYYLYRKRTDSASTVQNPHLCVQALESVLHALRCINKMADMPQDAKAQYLRRFPFTVVSRLNQALSQHKQLSNEEWREIAKKVKLIEEETGCWPYQPWLRTMVMVAPNRNARILMPLLLMSNNAYRLSRRTIGKLFRRVGIMKDPT